MSTVAHFRTHLRYWHILDIYFTVRRVVELVTLLIASFSGLVYISSVYSATTDGTTTVLFWMLKNWSKYNVLHVQPLGYSPPSPVTRLVANFRNFRPWDNSTYLSIQSSCIVITLLSMCSSIVDHATTSTITCEHLLVIAIVLCAATLPSGELKEAGWRSWLMGGGVVGWVRQFLLV